MALAQGAEDLLLLGQGVAEGEFQADAERLLAGLERPGRPGGDLGRPLDRFFPQGRIGEDAVFYTVDYDGVFNKTEGSGALAGMPEADRLMQRRLSRGTRRLSLKKAVDLALQTWAVGRWVGNLDEIPQEKSELEKAVDDADLDEVLHKELEELEVEAAILQRSRSGKCKYSVLSDKEIEASIKAYQA